MFLRVVNPTALPSVDPEDDYVICYVVEKVINLFDPNGPYTGSFVSPWGPQECAGEMHDTFNVMTRAFDKPRDGYFEGNIGATRRNNYDFFSFPTNGEAFLYHVGLFHKDNLDTELVNLNSAASSGTSTPFTSGATCAPTNTNGYCMNFGFIGGCADSVFFESLTIAPAVGDPTTPAYYASSTGPNRWTDDIYIAQLGWSTVSAGYEYKLSNDMPPMPPGVSYPARRRLAEMEDGTLTQNELHQYRMEVMAKDAWLQTMVPALREGWSNHSMLLKLEEFERNGASIASKYMHALLPRAPSPPPTSRRQLHWVPHYHPPPSTPPLFPPGEHWYHLPNGVAPEGWAAVPFWGNFHNYQQYQEGQVAYGAPTDSAAAYERQGASARVLSPGQWETALAHVLTHVDPHDIHSNLVGDHVQYMVDVNDTTRQGVLDSLHNAYFKSALSTAAHASVVAVSETFTAYHSHGLVSAGAR